MIGGRISWCGEAIMPTYSYRCEKCGKTFRVVESLAEHGKTQPACPKCGAKTVAWVPGPVQVITGKKT